MATRVIPLFASVIALGAVLSAAEPPQPNPVDTPAKPPVAPVQSRCRFAPGERYVFIRLGETETDTVVKWRLPEGTRVEEFGGRPDTAGQTAEEDKSKCELACGLAVQAGFIPDSEQLDATVKLWRQRRNVKDLVRSPCPSDRAFAAEMATRIRQLASDAAQHDAPALSLGIELPLDPGTGLAFCFCQRCLSLFRERLKEEYGGIAGLNAAWRTGFADFEEVTPLVLEKVRWREKRVPAGGRNFAPWLEYRRFRDELFVGVVGKAAEAARSGAGPGRPVGLVLRETHRADAGITSLFPALDWLGFLSDTPGARIAFSLAPRSKHVIGPPGPFSWTEGFSGQFLEPEETAALPDSALALVLPKLEPAEAKLALVYSRAGFLAARCIDRMTDPGTPPVSSVADSLHGWTALLDDLGFPYDFVNAPELKDGAVLHRRYAVVVLPRLLSVSRGTERTLENFVRCGGTLVADSGAGVMDELGCERAHSPLDDVFGIRRTEPKKGESLFAEVGGLRLATSGSRIRYVRNCRYPADIYPRPPIAGFGAAQAGVVPVESAVTASAARAGGTYCLIANELDAGRAFFLNLPVSAYPELRPREEAAEAMRLIARAVVGSSGLAARCPVRCAGKELPVRKRELAGESVSLLAVIVDAHTAERFAGRTATIDLSAGRAGSSWRAAPHVYDLQTGMYFGRTTAVEFAVEEGLHAYSLLKYRVAAVEVAVDAVALSGEDIVVEISIRRGTEDEAVESKERFAPHAVRAWLLPEGPNRTRAWEKIAPLARGTCRFTIPEPVCRAAGTWKLYVRDALSGRTVVRIFRRLPPGVRYERTSARLGRSRVLPEALPSQNDQVLP